MFTVYEIIIYWKDSSGKIKSFYKIGYCSYRLEARFDYDIRRGLKVFVINQLKVENRKAAEDLEKKWYKEALTRNHVEFKPKYHKELSVTADIGDFEVCPISFVGKTEVLRTPSKFEGLVEKLDRYFERNPNVCYLKYFNNDLHNTVEG